MQKEPSTYYRNKRCNEVLTSPTLSDKDVKHK